MSEKILQLNLKFNVSRAEYEQTAGALADAFAAVPGCRWKIWLMNESSQEAGGIYLFENEAALNALLNSELAARVLGHPALSDFSVKQFDVLPEQSRITRAPIGAQAAAAPPSAAAARPDVAH